MKTSIKAMKRYILASQKKEHMLNLDDRALLEHSKVLLFLYGFKMVEHEGRVTFERTTISPARIPEGSVE